MIIGLLLISLYDLIIIDKTKIKENGLDRHFSRDRLCFQINQKNLLKNFILWLDLNMFLFFIIFQSI